MDENQVVGSVEPGRRRWEVGSPHETAPHKDGTHGVGENFTNEPRTYGEVEGGEDQGVVEGVPGGQGVKEPADQGKGGVGL